MGFQPPRYPWHPPVAAREAAQVVIAGGGLVGLTLALDLARQGIASVLLDEDDTVSTGSRAICWAKRTLEIYGRLGLGARFLEKGVTWNRGRVFHGEREAYAFDLLPEQGHEYPAFVNLQQYYAEAWLAEECAASGLVDLRWRHRVAAVEHRPDGALLRVETPGGEYQLEAEWLLACDGARSPIREGMGLPFLGQVFRDRFLIADVRMHAPFPAERWFWFDPPFHPGQSVLLHKQPDDIWRIDFQLGWEADPEAERDPARVRARVAAMLGPKVSFELEWVSVYSFRCRRIERFRHGRTIFLGDAAHQVSPFGARGGNGGVQDADNLAWKLAAVLRGATPALLDSYDRERVPAAEENILNSTRSTDFITPKTAACHAWRDAVLELSAAHGFARPLVNSGRLSRPAVLADSPLSTPDAEAWGGGLPPGAPAVDAPMLRAGQPDWLLRHLGREPVLLAFAGPGVPAAEAPAGLRRVVVAADERVGTLWDHSGLAAARWGARPGDAVLLRPDQHVAARFHAPSPAAIAAARARMMGEA
ncbi:FAD-dependent oxidoreductase [Belnapia sp. T6]|uniref:FAD-dependent oxidoreductase n=1 Tax=Belnapia mucosa TaxID=2804532 RepID=A0ABS1V0I2_9PROT|nr:FAD-dependent oxidoreductase [Belnapia mucosa]MBL6453788.1 FAD-dependent oxidoreductase [Belnapia mucosa]